jgi:GNAT superfamily N-acetyltransferase
MSAIVLVRKALTSDAFQIEALLTEWFDWSPSTGRSSSINRAIEKGELTVAQSESRLIGFIHYIFHEDIIDGGLNAFISAFFVSASYRGKGVGSLLLEAAISEALANGAVGMETSTIHARAKKLYERHHFKQTVGDIGEAFLELDIEEYRRGKESKNESVAT